MTAFFCFRKKRAAVFLMGTSRLQYEYGREGLLLSAHVISFGS